MNKLIIPMLFLTSCSIGPNFETPTIRAPKDWASKSQSAEQNSQIVTNSSANTDWWNNFNDLQLTSLIERAQLNNLNLKQAVLKIAEVRAAKTVARSDYFPTINGSAGYRVNGNVQNTNSEEAFYQANLDASWELDLFGRIRRSVEAAGADIEIQEEERNDVMISLISEVALNYLNLRGLQQELEITKQNIAAQTKSSNLTNQLFQAGFVSALDVANANALTATTSSQIPSLEASIEKTIFDLSLLLAQEPSALKAELALPLAIPSTPPEVPVGLPSDLLRRRPDIRKAEALIRLETARVGVAIGELFPKFSLTGGFTLQGEDGSALTYWDNRSWFINPMVSLPIFNAGRLRANVAAQEARQEQAILAYQQSVLKALRDVDAALIDYQKEQTRRQLLIAAVGYNERAVKLAQELYSSGSTDFLNVISAQRALYSSQIALVQNTRTISANLARIYKALGGGWETQQK